MHAIIMFMIVYCNYTAAGSTHLQNKNFSTFIVWLLHDITV